MRLRLKDLDKISGETVDFYSVMKEVFGFKKYWFFRKIMFSIYSKKAYSLIKEYRNIDISKLEYNKDSNIKKPSVVDNITYRAMMELHQAIGNANEDSNPADVMANTIAIACYSENSSKKKYDSECSEFKNFKERILNEPLEDMVGLYNTIYQETHDTQLEWKKRFMSVKVDNPDMEKAGISRMNQFNVISTIKSTCQDFNVTYDEAWQMSYSLTQTNAYSRATLDHIHENLRVIKEQQMKAKRKQRNS